VPDNLRESFSSPLAMSQTIFFAHANGFPSATYGKLFSALEPDYRVRHLEQHGHDPRFPVDDNWNNLVDELILHVEQGSEPVWGVGHSLGGVLHYHAALRRPELYRGVVMLDSPLLTGVDRLVIRAAKRFGFIDRITPAGRTVGRREAFGDVARRVTISPARRCSAVSTPNAWTPTCVMACARRARGRRGACACASIRPPRSASTAACRIPCRAGRNNWPYRLPWCVAGTARWYCRTMHGRSAACPRVSI